MINGLSGAVVVFPTISIAVTVHVYSPFPLSKYISNGMIHVIPNHIDVIHVVIISIHEALNAWKTYHDIAVLSDPVHIKIVLASKVIPLAGAVSVIEGVSLSIQPTVAVSLHVFPTASVKLKMNKSLSVNV